MLSSLLEVRRPAAHRRLSFGRAAGAVVAMAVLATSAMVALPAAAPPAAAGSVDPALTPDNAPSLTLRSSTGLPDNVDSRPVMAPATWTSDGQLRDLVITTSELGIVSAVDAEVGEVVWQRAFTNPSCTFNNNGTYPCFTTAGPVLDPSGQTVFTVGLDGYVHRVSLADGGEIIDGLFPVQITNRPWDEKVSSNLSAVTDRAGHHYIYATVAGYPGNGMFPGDRGDYQGHIVAIGVTTRQVRVFNSLCSNITRLLAPGECPETQSGIWARPGVVYSAATNRIYATTGNGNYDPANHHWGNSVIALNPDGSALPGGVPLDAWTPTNWADLEALDDDLGSSNVTPMNVPPGSSFANVALVSGKDNVLRMLDLENLSGQGGPGHLGGEIDSSVSLPQRRPLTTQPVAWVDPAGNPWVIVSNGGQTFGYRIMSDSTGKPVPELKWTQPFGKSTPTVVNGTVIVIDNENIVALRAESGAVAWHKGFGGVHWQSVTVTCGNVIVPVLSSLVVWELPDAGCWFGNPYNPFGRLDAVSAPTANELRVQGWAFDPDDAAVPLSVLAFVDGTAIIPGFANHSRTDIAAVFPAAGPQHGFDFTIAVGPGRHDVCLMAVNRSGVGGGTGENTIVGCESVDVPSAQPFGSVDSAQSSTPGSFTVAGWAIDPDTAEPIQVAVYLDGQGVGWFPADSARPDVGAVHPAAGPNHGFSITVPADGGSHQVCLFAINVGELEPNPLLGCRVVVVPNGAPFGSFDSARWSGPGAITMTGWAIDPDTADPIPVAVYLDGRGVSWFPADASRPDVAAVYPSYGNDHGFSITVPASGGSHQVCVFAINVGEPAPNPLLGCRDVPLPVDPFGHLDTVRTGDGSVTVAGWAIDPDTGSPIQVAVYRDGQGIAWFPAGESRPDVGAIYPAYGNNHGFVITIPASAASHNVCVFAINTGAGSGNPLLGCRTG